MRLIIIMVIFATIVSRNLMVAECEESNKLKIQLIKYNKGKATNPLLLSKYVLMSSVEKIQGAFNYIFLTDLYGPHFLLLQSRDECKLTVDFDAIINGRENGSVKFLNYQTNEPCDMLKDTYVLMRMDRLLELDDKNSTIINKKYDFDRDYSLLQISNHTTINSNNIVDEFFLQFSNIDSNITLNIGYYGQNHTMSQLPNIPVGPLVGLIGMQVQNLTVSKNSKLAVQLSFTSSANNQKFVSSLNRFYSDLQTPGVFRTYNISLVKSDNFTKSHKFNQADNVDDNKNSFIQNISLFWKAIAYTDNPPRRSSQIMANVASNFTCGDNQNNDNEGVRGYSSMDKIINVLGLSQVKTYDCFRVDFTALNKDTSFFSTKYMGWSFTFGFISYYSNITPVSVVWAVAVSYALPLIVGTVLFLLSKTTFKRRTQTIYNDISDEEENLGGNLDEEIMDRVSCEK